MTLTGDDLETITQTKVELYIQKIKEGKKIDVAEALSSIFLLLHSKTKEIEILKAKVSSLEEKLNKAEAKIYEKQILIKKVPLHSGVRRHSRESSSQTRSVIEELFEAVKFNGPIPDCYRIPLTPTNAMLSSNRGIFPVIVCNFNSKNDKMAFYGHLKKLKDTENFKEIVISDNIPPFLLNKFKLANTKAFELRKNGNCYTKIRVVKNDIVLFSKKKSGNGSKDFSETPY